MYVCMYVCVYTYVCIHVYLCMRRNDNKSGGGEAVRYQSQYGFVWQHGARVKTPMPIYRPYTGAKTITWMLYEVEFVSC